jgi:hypothetical protein
MEQRTAKGEKERKKGKQEARGWEYKARERL